MKTSIKALVLSLAAAAALLVFGSTRVDASPTVVRCGAGTHAVVTHPIVEGRRIRRVTCARDIVARRHVVGTSGTATTTTAPRCGAGFHERVRYRTVDGRRVRRVICVR
jgi:hypothetical protein